MLKAQTKGGRLGVTLRPGPTSIVDVVFPITHASNKYLLSIYYMLGTVPGTWNTSVNKTHKTFCLCRIHILMGRQAINQKQSVRKVWCVRGDECHGENGAAGRGGGEFRGDEVVL